MYTNTYLQIIKIKNVKKSILILILLNVYALLVDINLRHVNRYMKKNI